MHQGLPINEMQILNKNINEKKKKTEMINEKQTGRQTRNSYQCVCLIKTHGQMHRKQGERTHNYIN